MPPVTNDPATIRQWLEDAWRHGEVIADRDGRLTPAASRQPALLSRLRRYGQRMMQRPRR